MNMEEVRGSACTDVPEGLVERVMHLTDPDAMAMLDSALAEKMPESLVGAIVSLADPALMCQLDTVLAPAPSEALVNAVEALADPVLVDTLDGALALHAPAGLADRIVCRTQSTLPVSHQVSAAGRIWRISRWAAAAAAAAMLWVSVRTVPGSVEIEGAGHEGHVADMQTQNGHVRAASELVALTEDLADVQIALLEAEVEADDAWVEQMVLIHDLSAMQDALAWLDEASY